MPEVQLRLPVDLRSSQSSNTPSKQLDSSGLIADTSAMVDVGAFAYADLFAGIGGFHAMLDHAGGRCVYVSEIDAEARKTYCANWIDDLPESRRPTVNTDISIDTPEELPVGVPAHDVLAAGFPCQPFSKSGYQRGMDEARGTLFWNIARVLEQRTPAVVLLENVRNLVGPRHRHEWDVIVKTLREIGYRVSSTPTVFSPHLLPPWLGGTPQVRDRVFILGTYIGPDRVQAELRAGVEPGPTVARAPVDGWNPQLWDAAWALDDDESIEDLDHFRLSAPEQEWVATWDDLVQRIWSETGTRLPGFPLWADDWVPSRSLNDLDLMALPGWKSSILVKNAKFYDEHRQVITAWRKANPQFLSFPASRRKLEWQAQDTASLWDTVMHFRPSGIRAKAPTYLPALVAITQTSIYGPRKRRITPHEAARLQGLGRDFTFGAQRDAASYKQVGNGVAVGAAWYVFRTHVERDAADLPSALVKSVLGAKDSPTRDALSGVPSPTQLLGESWVASAS